MSISFLILNFNQTDLTFKCLDSIQKHEPRAEILVLDNGTPAQGESDVLEIYCLINKIRFYHSDRNLGVAGGRNFLIKNCKGKIVIIIDNDVILTDSVSKCVIELLVKSEVGVCGKEGILFDNALEPYAQRQNNLLCDAISGYFFGFKKDLTRKIGFFEEKYQVYGWEDLDFCLKAKKAGYQIMANWDFPIVHKVHQSSSTLGKNRLKELDIHNRQVFVNSWKNHLDLLEINRQNISYLKCATCGKEWKK